MQCPYNHNEMVAMYDELSNIDDGSWEHVKGCGRNTLCIVLGCELPELDGGQCKVIWEITGKTVCNIKLSAKEKG